MIAAALAVLAWSHQAPEPPSVSAGQPRPDFLSWAGFKYLPAGDRVVGTAFPAPEDLGATLPESPAKPGATPWRLRVFVIQRVDSVAKLPDGTLYEENSALDPVDIDRVKKSVATLAKLVAAYSGNALQLVPQISVDDEPLELGSQTVREALRRYVYPRANGGRYDADDHIVRGPYESIVCLHPMTNVERSVDLIHGMPTSDLSVFGFPGYETDGALTRQLTDCLADAIRERGRASGLLGWGDGQDLKAVLGSVPSGDWSAVITGADLPGPEINSRLAMKFSNPTPSAPAGSPLQFIGANSDVKIEPDSDKGQMMAYIEKGTARNGGLCLPALGAGKGVIDVSKTPTLDVWLKSSAKEPLELRFESPDHAVSAVCLGADLPGTADVRQVSFDRDGTWHQVKINLKATNLSTISEIRLQPTPNALQHPKATLGPIEYDFASLEATVDSPDPDVAPSEPSADSPDTWARARWAHTAKPSAKLLALLKDPEWFVELNAIQAYIAQPDPEAEPVLTQDASLTIDGPVAAAACRALWALGTPTAKAEVHQIIQIGSTEQAKAECARILGETKDSKLAPELIILQQSRRLATRIATVEALGQMTDENAAIIRMTFLFQDDPEQKLEVTRTSVPTDDYQWRKLLWSSVNESSDAVRLESDEKLLGATDPTGHAGGTAGVKDDSIQVRIQLLEFMAAHPDEANRDAIRLAVIDRSASVKAAAIDAFATLPKGVKPDELGAVVTDTHPIVQIALLKLAKEKKIVLPDAVLKQMAASGDPDVQSALKALNS